MNFTATDRSPDEDGKNFIKLKAGESVVGVLRGEPHEHGQHWVGNISHNCIGKTGGKCPFCLNGDKPKFRFKLNMIVLEEGKLVCKILGGGWKLYQQLSELAKAGWDLEQMKITISRTGSTQNDTAYWANPVPPPKGDINAVTKDALAKVVLFDFTKPEGEKVVDPKKQPEPPHSAFSDFNNLPPTIADNEDIPF